MMRSRFGPIGVFALLGITVWAVGGGVRQEAEKSPTIERCADAGGRFVVSDAKLQSLAAIGVNEIFVPVGKRLASDKPAPSVATFEASTVEAAAQVVLEQGQIDGPSRPTLEQGGIWRSEAPAGCPFAPSKTLTNLRFTGRRAAYCSADTWYPSWASDGKMYSSWTDGSVNKLKSDSNGPDATTGNATILGDDPMKLQIVNEALYESSPLPYGGRYPCGSLVYNGVWYYGTYCLGPKEGNVTRDGKTYNWPWLGPFVGFRYSTDLGKTWTQTPRTPDKPLFGESSLKGEPLKIGSPHFVDFGKNMEHSPDGKAYLVAHGASDGANRRFAYNSWITGDEIYLLRVTPSIRNFNDASKYEFFGGHDGKGAAVWSNDIAKIKPIATWRDNMGCVTVTYDAPLKKYLMCVTDGRDTVGHFNTYLLEADQVAGPWKLVTYMKRFGEQAYFVNIPSRFISRDGRTMWLCYSANFAQAAGFASERVRTRPPGSGYGMCLQEVKILSP